MDADTRITIESLQVMFEAAGRRDEAYLAELVDRRLARHDSVRATDDAAACQAAGERAVGDGRAWA
jgi:hypothetical protein